MNPNLVIEYLGSQARARILERFGPRSCIASTRIAMEVCRRHGIECWPQAVKVEVLNARAVKAQAEGVPWALGTYGLGVEGTGTFEGGDWDGHLILVFKDSKGEVLLDLSADQMHRPQHGVHVTEPIAVRIGDKGWPVGLWLPEGGLVAYERIRSRGYRQARDWTLRARWEPTLTQIEEDLRCLA